MRRENRMPGALHIVAIGAAPMGRDPRDSQIFPLVKDGDPSSTSSAVDDSEEVSNDAIQLLVISVFNGLCRTISALAENGLLDAEQLDGIHDAMTTPLDHPPLRDDEFINGMRETIEDILAEAVRDVRRE